MDKNIKLRLLSTFIQNIGTVSIFPFMALLLSQNIGAKNAGIVLIIGIFLKIIASLVGGYVSDILKKQKSTIIFFSFISCLILVLMSFLVSNLNGVYIYIFIIIYILNELIFSFVAPLQNSLTLDYVTEYNRQKYSIFRYWIINLSIAIGMAIGSLFYNNYKSELFIFVSICLFINILILHFLIFEKSKIHSSFITKSNYFYNLLYSYKIVLKDKSYLLMLIGYVLIVSGELTLSSYVSVRLSNTFEAFKFNIFYIDGVRVYSILLIINTIIVISFSLVIPKVTNNFSQINKIIIGSIFYTLGYTILMSNNSFFILVLFIIIASLGEIIYSPTYHSEKIKLIPKNKKGSYSALEVLCSPSSDFISKNILIFGSFISPIFISIIMFIILSSGFILIVIMISKNINRSMS